MKKALILICIWAGILLDGALGVTIIGGRTATTPIFITNYYLSNCVEITPSDDLDIIYNTIKAKTPASANRWVIRYYPGTYTRTTAYIWDADYIDHEGLGVSPDDVIITRAGGGPAVTQTASDVRCTNFTIRNTGNTAGDHGFLINAVSNNNASEYSKMKFKHPNVKPYSHYPVFAVSDLGGTWKNCEADDYAWRCANGGNLTAAMYNCTAGIYSFMGDNEGTKTGTGKLTGYLVGCVAGDYSFASCSSWGSEISGTLIDCAGGICSFAIGKPISGTLVRCAGGGNSFAGWSGNPGVAFYGSITGTLVDCVASGGNSFAMGHVSCVQSGSLIRCKNGGYEGNANGLSGAAVSTVIDASAYASVSTSYLNPNNDLTFTAKELGQTGNNIHVYYRFNPLRPAVVITGWSQGNIRKIDVQYKAVTKASEIKSMIEADPLANSWVMVTYADGNGSGVIGSMISAAHQLAGGAGIPTFTGCCPDRPILCAMDRTIFPFDNGATYSNQGATGKIALTLPVALCGYEYTIWDLEDTPDCDITIIPSGSDVIVGDEDNQLVADDNINQFIKIRCLVNGKWLAETSSGIWD